MSTPVKLVKIGDSLSTFLSAARSDRQDINVALPQDVSGKDRVVVTYGEYVHGVARSAADVLELCPTLFPGLSFKATQLRSLEEDVRADGIIIRQVDSAVESLKEQCNGSKDQLCRAVTLVRDTVRAAWDNPCTPPEVRKQLEVHGRPLLALIQERNDQISDRRAANKDLRDSANDRAKTAEVAASAATLTTKVLRGDDLPPEAVQPPPRRLFR